MARNSAADSVGLALLVVLDRLTADERLAFVLHDTFSVSFDVIASILSSTPGAARQLASRARRRVKDSPAPAPDRDPARQHQVVDAFFADSRDGDFEALVALLNPDIVLRSDGGPGPPDASATLRGARTSRVSRAFAASTRSRRRARPPARDRGGRASPEFG